MSTFHHCDGPDCNNTVAEDEFVSSHWLYNGEEKAHFCSSNCMIEYFTALHELENEQEFNQ